MHFILKGAPDVELILDGIYSDKTNRLFKLDKHIDMLSQGFYIHLLEINTGTRTIIPQSRMEAYVRGGALKYENFCATCTEWLDKVKLSYEEKYE